MNALQQVYMAGRMVNRDGGGGDNKTPGQSYRPFDILNMDLPEADHPHSPVEERALYGVPFLYTGPWQAKGSYHGLIHGITSVGDVSPRGIVQRALHGIEQCDIFFALLDGEDCHGTLTEIGYAKARGKPVVVGVTPEISVEDADIHNARWHQMGSELWFAIEMADVRLTGDILRQFAAMLAMGKRYPDGNHRRLSVVRRV